MEKRHSISVGLKIVLFAAVLLSLWPIVGSFSGIIMPFSPMLVVIFGILAIFFVVGLYFSLVEYQFVDGGITVHYPLLKAREVPKGSISGWYFKSGSNVGSFVFLTDQNKKIDINFSGSLKKALPAYVQSINHFLVEKGISSIEKNGQIVYGSFSRAKYKIDNSGIEVLKTGQLVKWSEIEDIKVTENSGVTFYEVVPSVGIAFNNLAVNGNIGIAKYLREKT